MLIIKQTELLSLENVNADSAKLLTEKLALSRELSILKPELEHLRSQAASNQSLLSEKLSLQRQLSSVEVELENEKRAKQRLQDKSSKKSMDRRDAVEEHEAELEDLRKNLKEEKVLHREAKKDAERLRGELDTEKQKTVASRTQAESAQVDIEAIDDLRMELAREKKEREKAENRADSAEKKVDKADKSDSAQLDELKKDLAKEKKEREKAERNIQKAQSEWEAQKELLDDKLNQFRTKLKSTKEKLKDTEAELEKARPIVANAKAVADFNGRPGPKNSKKRAADLDVALGTPGDGPKAKRGRKGQSLVGEKSSFSMTPFLNRTSGIAVASPVEEEDEEEAKAEDATPIAATKKATKKAASTKSKALAPAASAKANSKAAGKNKKASVAVPTLEKVAEEEASLSQDAAIKTNPAIEDVSDGQENAAPAAGTTKLPLGAPVPKLKPSSAATKKPRKSIHLFPNFNAEPEPEKKKKRKLGQGFGSTLFDEEEDQGPAKPIPGRMFAGRAFAAIGKGKGGKAMIQTNDGFQFSPLKKERRGGSVQPSFLG